MKKLSLVLALCAFIAAPAFAEEQGGTEAAKEATTANETVKAPAKHGKTKVKKGKKAKAHAEKAAGAEGEAAHEAAHQ